MLAHAPTERAIVSLQVVALVTTTPQQEETKGVAITGVRGAGPDSGLAIRSAIV